MTPPKQLFRVEWDAARHPDRPHERAHQSRNFSAEEHAGAQVASIGLWSPKFMELTGVWRTAGDLIWEKVDPDTLETDAGARARFADLARYSPDNPEWVRMGVTDE